jgi:hypothetical protein
MRSLSNCVVVCMNRSSRKVNGWVLCCAVITRITACRPTSRHSTCSGGRLRIAGLSRFGDEASAAASTGREWIDSRNNGFLVPALFILGRNSALLSEPKIRAQCGSSARWDLCGGRLARSRVNRPYRDPPIPTNRIELDAVRRITPRPRQAERSPAARLGSPEVDCRLTDRFAEDRRGLR